MSFELDSRGADELDELAQTNGVPLGGVASEPGFFSGTLTAPVKGLARGLVAKPALLLGDAATPVLRSSARSVDKVLGTTLDSWLADQQKRNVAALDDLRPDPATTGFAGQVVHSLFDIGSSAMLYTPEGAAALEGYSRRQELISKGVDEGTASAVGAVSGVATLIGVKAPVTLGAAAAGQGAKTIATNAVYGASTASGVAERGTSRELLERSGYVDQAALLDPFDKQALAAEFILGGLFSGGASALGHRSTVRAQEAADAAMAVQAAKHAALDTAPGVPADTRSMAAHQRAMAAAFDQELAGERVNVGDTLSEATFVRDTSATARATTEHIQAEARSHVADLLTERAPDIERSPVRPPPSPPAEVGPIDALAATLGRVVDTLLGTPEPVAAQIKPSTDPTIRAAADVATTRPDMRVALEDGTNLSAREAVDRAHGEREMVTRDSAAFEAAVNCLLRN
jgi:hypothetical protein